MPAASRRLNWSRLHMLDHNAPLREADPVVARLIDKELRRQQHGLELIASENFASRAVIDVCSDVGTISMPYSASARVRTARSGSSRLLDNTALAVSSTNKGTPAALITS